MFKMNLGWLAAFLFFVVALFAKAGEQAGYAPFADDFGGVYNFLWNFVYFLVWFIYYIENTWSVGRHLVLL